MRRFSLSLAVAVWAVTIVVVAADDPHAADKPATFAAKSAKDDERADDERAEFFRKKILPVLKESCFECHSAEADDLKGNLRLDTRDGLRMGGDNGPAVVPNELEASFLWKTIQYMEDDYKMPPKGKMDDKVLGDFRKWITDGAVDPR